MNTSLNRNFLQKFIQELIHIIVLKPSLNIIWHHSGKNATYKIIGMFKSKCVKKVKGYVQNLIKYFRI